MSEKRSAHEILRFATLEFNRSEREEQKRDAERYRAIRRWVSSTGFIGVTWTSAADMDRTADMVVKGEAPWCRR